MLSKFNTQKESESGMNDKLSVKGQVLVILTNKDTGEKRVYETHNIVTNAGDRFYAEQAVNGALTKNFLAAGSGMRLGTNGAGVTKADVDVGTFVAGSGKVYDGGYPKTADADPDNTGAGVNVVTWRVTYGTSEANSAGIAEVAIVDDKTAPTAALSHALFSSPFTKTSSDTLKVIVNNSLLGV